MSQELQLELNLENKNSYEMQLFHLQKEVAAMNESMGKVRRKLFGEMGELKKFCQKLMQENTDMKQALLASQNKKTEWVYSQEDFLFKTAM